MNKELKEAIKELKDLQMAFGFTGIEDTQEYNYLRNDEPENYKTALAIETILNYIENSISKEVIEKKIEVLSYEHDKYNYGLDDMNMQSYYKACIELLQELLEGK